MRQWLNGWNGTGQSPGSAPTGPPGVPGTGDHRHHHHDRDLEDDDHSNDLDLGDDQGSRICGTFSDPELTPNLFSERVC